MLEKRLLQEIKSLDLLIKKLEKKDLKKPEGRLRIVKHGKKPHYFHVKKDTQKGGVYIPLEKQGLAKELAEKDYYSKLLKAAIKERRALKRFLKSYSHDMLGDVYSKMNPFRKELLKPERINDEDFVKIWESREYIGNSFNQEEKRFKTRKGELVRSKSELMIANIYYSFGIPYRYEAPFYMADGAVKYPDFTVLKMPERKEIIHEHMGLMDREDYRRSNLRKINEYALNGVHIGYNFLVTFETEENPFDERLIREMIQLYFECK